MQLLAWQLHERVTPKSPACLLIEVSPFIPGAGQVLLRLAADINGQSRLFWKCVFWTDGFKSSHIAECAIQPFLRESDRNNHISRGPARSPRSILVVAANRFGQAIVLPKIVERSGFAVVVGKQCSP